MKKSDQKLLNCLMEIYGDSERTQGYVSNVSNYAEAHGIDKAVEAIP